MTFNQIKEQEGQIRKGAKAEMVIYFNVFYKDSNDQTLEKEEAMSRYRSGEDIKVLNFIKYYNVFNIDDIEGIDFNIPEITLMPNEKLSKCEAIIEAMPKRPELKCIDANRAFYSPQEDFVNIPAIEQFESAEYYYATLFHELIHSTGHSSGLFRLEVMSPLYLLYRSEMEIGPINFKRYYTLFMIMVLKIKGK